MEKFKSGIFASIMVLSMSVGIMASIVVILTEDISALPILVSIIVGAIVTAIIAGIAFLPYLLKLRQVTNALQAINQNKRVETIQPLPLGLMSSIIDEVNVLLENQMDFQSMRGRLYQQISEVAAQEERNRLARDLHDSIKQQVFSMSVSAAAAHAHLDMDINATRSALLDVRQSAQEAMVEMRVLLQQLAPAPLEQSGLVESIRQQMEALSYRTGARIETQFDKLPSDDLLPIGAQETLFRITQEALSNIARHARAKNVSLSLKHNPSTALILTVKDDGQGFNMENVQRGMGLNNIEQRLDECNGTLDCDSHIGEGTTLSITIPLGANASQVDLRDIREKHKKEATKVYHRYMGFAGLMAQAIFSITVSIRGMLNDAPVSFVILMMVLGVGSGIGSLFVWRSYRRVRDAVMPKIPAHEPAWYTIKQNIIQAHWLLALACLFVIPGTFVGIEGYLWLPTLVGGIIFIVNLLLIFRTLFLQEDHMQSLLPFEMEEALRTYRATLTSGVAASVFAAGTIFLPGNSTGTIYLTPTDIDQWDNNFFLGMMTTFVVYYTFAIGHYWYWTKKNAQQSEVQI